MGSCLPCRSSHSLCHTQSSPWFNLLTTNACIAPRSIFQSQAIHSMNFISPPQQKAIPPATRSHLPPPPWPSCSQVATACSCPPPQPSCSLPAGTTTVATTQATLIPLGSTTGKVTGQAIGCGPTATSTDPVTAQAALTPQTGSLAKQRVHQRR